MIASWIERLGWMPPQTVASTPKVPVAPSPDLQQLQQIEAHIGAVRQAVERQLADVRETVDQLAAGQANPRDPALPGPFGATLVAGPGSR